MSRKWDQIRQDSFPEWINHHLEERELHINCIEDLSNGVLLVKLLEIISGKRVKRHVAKPRFLQQKIDNVNVALQFLQNEMGLKVIGCNPQDIVSGNSKQIMGIIFLLIQYTKRKELEYLVSGESEGEITESESLVDSSSSISMLIDVHDEEEEIDDRDDDDIPPGIETQQKAVEASLVEIVSESDDGNVCDLETDKEMEVEGMEQAEATSSDVPLETDDEPKQEVVESKNEDICDKVPNEDLPVDEGELETQPSDLPQELGQNNDVAEVKEDEQEGFSKEEDVAQEENTFTREEANIAHEESKPTETQEDQSGLIDEAPTEETIQTLEEESIQVPEEETMQTLEEETMQTPEEETIQTLEGETSPTPEEETIEIPMKETSKPAEKEEEINQPAEREKETSKPTDKETQTPLEAEMSQKTGEAESIQINEGTEAETTAQIETSTTTAETANGEARSEKKKSSSSRRTKKEKSRRKARSRRGPRGRKLEKLNSEQEILEQKNRITRMLKQRTTIADELLQTERSYVNGLTVLLDSFLRPLRENSILSAASLRRIFSDIEVLYGFNCQFLNNLKARIENWDAHGQKLGDIFLREVAYLKMYTMYVNNYNESVKEVSECRKRVPKFAEYVDKTRYSDECKGLDLTSYLIMPVQRIPRYVMLLGDLLKNTPESHPDYEDLKASVEKTKEVADYVNEKKREAENINQVVAVQELLGGKIELLEDASRRFVREGPLVDISGTEKRNRYYFLFNDILVAASQGNKEFKESWKRESVADVNASSMNQISASQVGGLKYKASVSLSGAQLRETLPSLQDLDEKLKNMFQLVPSEGESKMITLIAPSYESKTSWMGDIDECIMHSLENRKIRSGAFTNYDLSHVKDMPCMYDTLLMQNTETGVWKERYVILKNGLLQWFRSEESQATPKGTLEIYSCSVRLHRPSEKEFAFQVFGSQQIYYFASHTGARLFKWVNAIRSVIEKIMEVKDQTTKKNDIKFGNLPPALAQMLTDSENQICADCSSTSLQYVNVTHGVFLCAECYNLHKILGCPVLKPLMRSRWTDGQARDLLSKGNKVVNEELENNQLKERKINSQSPYESKVEYIKSKYGYTDKPEPLLETRTVSPQCSPSKKPGRKSGWLVQLNDNENKKYFYILKKSNIYYYKNEKVSGTPSGVIDVQTATCRVSVEDETIFELITPSKIYTILCPSTDDRKDWIRNINHAKTEKPRTRSSIFLKPFGSGRFD